jgi:hypothetical protein
MNPRILKKQRLAITSLFLDPNNPRLKLDTEEHCEVADEQVEAKQDSLMKQFRKGNEDFFDLNSLKDSMERIGYVCIDRIVVRPLKCDSSKYLVIEGNRRIASIRELITEHENRKRVLPDEVVSSLYELDVMVLDPDILGEAETKHQISVILGIRHHGSLLEWEPLAKAFNLYKEYRLICPEGHRFTLNTKAVSEVRKRLAVPKKVVDHALKTYVVFLQLQEADPDSVKEHHYSLIEAIVHSNRLLTGYLTMDDTSYNLDEQSVERMFVICQFSERDQLLPEEKILPKPQSVAKLAKLVGFFNTHSSEHVRNYAQSLIASVEGKIDDAPRTSLDDAVDLLIAFINRQEWAQTLLKYLREQRDKLDYNTYLGTGNDRMKKDKLKAITKRISLLADLNSL